MINPLFLDTNRHQMVNEANLLSFYRILFFVLKFIKTIFKIKNRAINFLLILYIILAAVLIIIPLQFVLFMGTIIMIINIISFSLMFVLLLQIIRKGRTDAIFFLLSSTASIINSIWIIYFNSQLVIINYYPYDFIIAVTAFTFFLFKHHIDISKQNSHLTLELQDAVKVQDEFLANTSHELKNPLHGMINIAETIISREESTLTEKDKHT